MKRRDQILFIRDYGNHIISKSDFYKMLGVQTIYIIQSYGRYEEIKQNSRKN